MIPSISQRLILGIDFWKQFQLLPDIVGTMDTIFSGLSLPALAALTHRSEELCDKNLVTGAALEENRYPLSNIQRQQLDAVVNLFPSFDKH